MNTRPLNEQESKNLAALNQAGCNSVLLFLTRIGLKKGILDATEPMRRMFSNAGVHDYAVQGQGKIAKSCRRRWFLPNPSEYQFQFRFTVQSPSKVIALVVLWSK